MTGTLGTGVVGVGFANKGLLFVSMYSGFAKFILLVNSAGTPNKMKRFLYNSAYIFVGLFAESFCF